ncbi:MAG TPA: DUF4326 domain-containing protein [Amycolatopsis sp.]|nr:DUF4326 domain-containing protein [Amycolatopsis sp.]
MAHPLVVHCKRARFDVYIGRGRGSKWSNPFRIGVDGTREEVIDLYEAWLPEQPHLMASLGELTERTLGCWCAPLACHGEILTRLAARVPVLSPWGTITPLCGGVSRSRAPF